MNEFGIASLLTQPMTNHPLIESVKPCLSKDHVPYFEVKTAEGTFIVSVAKASFD